MTAIQVPKHGKQPAPYESESWGWVGWIAFAAIAMMLIGFFHAIQGLVALLNPSYYQTTSHHLLVQANYTAWGWVLLVAGIVVAVAGFFVFSGAVWARAVGVVVAMLSAIINLGFLSSYPLWGLMIIALDVMVILALTVHGAEIEV
ncbi:MAG: DUF7144 family membrane protein [Nocardioidaceae bacterium]